MSLRKRKSTVYVGTSGWSYDWDSFYEDVPNSRRFEHYASVFRTVEVNYSFYRLPKKITFQKWKDQAPEGFTFALKLSRYVTHIKRLKGVQGALRKFLNRASELGDALGPVLVQLPPNAAEDIETLDAFLKQAHDATATAVGRPVRFAVEFRDESWYTDAVFRTLNERNAALVFSHGSTIPYPDQEPITSDFVYLRLHGPGALYGSAYGANRLVAWARKIRSWMKRGKDAYVYFDNDQHGYAPKDARKLMELLG